MLWGYTSRLIRNLCIEMLNRLHIEHRQGPEGCPSISNDAAGHPSWYLAARRTWTCTFSSMSDVLLPQLRHTGYEYYVCL